MSEIAVRVARLRERVDALGEPDVGLHEACGGMVEAPYIAVNAINSVRQDTPGQTYQNDGEIRADVGEIREVFMKLEAVTPTVSAFVFSATDEPIVTYTLPDESSMPAQNSIEYVIEPVLQDWDVETLTYSNKPSDLGDSRVVRALFQVTGGSLVSVGADNDYTVSVTSSPTAFWGVDGYSLTAADIAAGRMIYGFRIQLLVTANGLDYVTDGEINTNLETQFASYIPRPTHYAMVL